MNRFTNPLDNIRVASPCRADWNQMYGNARKRFCADCKLNVYNLSDMTRDEAEDFLMASEGRLCVRFFRRADGTVLTKDCPVGWRAVKQRVSRIAVGGFSIIAGILGGLFSVKAVDSAVSVLPLGDVPPVKAPGTGVIQPANLPAEPVQLSEILGRPYINREVEGRVELTEFRRSMEDRKTLKVVVVGDASATPR